MAFLSDIFGTGGVAALGGKIADIVNKKTMDVNAAAEANVEIQKILLTQDMALAQGQDDINKIEAASTSFFVAGWRPFIGWLCGFGFGYQFIVYQFILWGNAIWKWTVTPPPPLDMGTLMTLLTGMLGLGGYRTFEKMKGVAGNH